MDEYVEGEQQRGVGMDGCIYCEISKSGPDKKSRKVRASIMDDGGVAANQGSVSQTSTDIG